MNVSVPKPNSSESWPSFSEDAGPDIVVSMDEFEQPQLTAMLLHQTATIGVTLLGNLLMIFVILRHNEIKNRRRITPVQMLMLHMCTSDILYALITIFPTMLMTITVPVFYGPNLLCKAVRVLQVLPMYSSSFLLVAISADRYFAICRPLVHMRHGEHRPMLYAWIAWALAIVLSMPQSFFFEKNELGDCATNYSEPWHYAAYAIAFNVIVWLVPSLSAGILYYKVCRAVWKSIAYDQNRPSPIRKPTALNGGAKIASGNGDCCREKGTSHPAAVTTPLHPVHERPRNDKLDRQRIATVKLTLTIVAANFLLWAPFCIISVIDSVSPEFLSPVVATYIMFFGNLNSCMNPWIWFFFNKKRVLRVLKHSFLFHFFCGRSDASSRGTSPRGFSIANSGTEKMTLGQSYSRNSDTF